MESFVNFYKELEIVQSATEEEIRKKLNQQNRVWSNRINTPHLEPRQAAERMVKIIDQAQDILLDASKRKEYDAKLIEIPTAEKKVDEEKVSKEENLVQLGWKLLIDGNVPDALFVATQATKRDPENPETWSLLGQAKFRWGEHQDAISDYKRAINLVPNQAEYYFDIGSIYESIENYKEALVQYQRAVQIDPKQTYYRAAVGILLIKAERYEEGMKLLKQCIKEEPNNPTYQWFLAIGYSESAYLGWTPIGEGHPHVEPGWYATEYSQVVSAQEKLDKAMALKFDDPMLMADLKQIKIDIDSMTGRKIMANWVAPSILAVIGFIFIAAKSAGIGIILLLIAALYVISSLTPQYKINARTIKGKVYSEFAWLSDMIGGKGGCVGAVIFWMIIFILMPFVTIYNFIRNFAIK